MATKKQRKRLQKERRHEYENVWILPDGTVSDEPPEDYVEPESRDTKAKSKEKPQQRRQPSSSRATRTPIPPSWRRSAKRSAMLGVVILVVFSLLNKKSGSAGYLQAFLLAVMYTALFIPFTYYLDRYAYNRYQRKTGGQAEKPPRKR